MEDYIRRPRYIGTIYVTILDVLEIIEYLDGSGPSSFGRWFSAFNAPAAAKVTTALIRVEHGNLSNVKAVGAGVFEYKIEFGPGYRIYFVRDGDRLVILVGGGTKKRQDADMRNAHLRWQDYRQRKAKGE